MATVIDTLFLELGIDSGKFGTQAKEAENRLDRMSASFGRAEKSAAKSSKGLEKQAAQSAKKHQAGQKPDAGGRLPSKGLCRLHRLGDGFKRTDKMYSGRCAGQRRTGQPVPQHRHQRNNVQAWGEWRKWPAEARRALKGSPGRA